MVVDCQPYAPAAFTPRKCSWYSFLSEAESTPGTGRTELRLSGLSGMTSHPDTKKFRIIGFFFANRLHRHFEVGEKILQTAVLGFVFIYVQIKH